MNFVSSHDLIQEYFSTRTYSLGGPLQVLSGLYNQCFLLQCLPFFRYTDTLAQLDAASDPRYSQVLDNGSEGQAWKDFKDSVVFECTSIFALEATIATVLSFLLQASSQSQDTITLSITLSATIACVASIVASTACGLYTQLHCDRIQTALSQRAVSPKFLSIVVCTPRIWAGWSVAFVHFAFFSSIWSPSQQGDPSPNSSLPIAARLFLTSVLLLVSWHGRFSYLQMRRVHEVTSTLPLYRVDTDLCFNGIRNESGAHEEATESLASSPSVYSAISNSNTIAPGFAYGADYPPAKHHIADPNNVPTMRDHLRLTRRPTKPTVLRDIKGHYSRVTDSH